MFLFEYKHLIHFWILSKCFLFLMWVIIFSNFLLRSTAFTNRHSAHRSTHQCRHKVLEKQPRPLRYILDGHVPLARLIDDAPRTAAAHALIVRIAPAAEARHALVSMQFDRQRNVIRTASAVVAVAVAVCSAVMERLSDYLWPDSAKSRCAKCERVRTLREEIRRCRRV